MANLTIQITKALASLRRIENILAVKTTEDSGTINQLTDSDIIISFEDVSFRFLTVIMILYLIYLLTSEKEVKLA